jgi:hypothetical protein
VQWDADGSPQHSCEQAAELRQEQEKEEEEEEEEEEGAGQSGL